MTGFIAVYIFMLAAFTGYGMASGVPPSLHRPYLSGLVLINGVVLVGAIALLAYADGFLEQALGFVGVALAAASVMGGYLVTRRLLQASRSGGVDE